MKHTHIHASRDLTGEGMRHVCRFGFLLACLLLGIIQTPVFSQSSVDDDFESYTVGSWPGANWVPDANAHDSNANGVRWDPLDPQNKTLRVFGVLGSCWGALGFHPCAFPEHFVLSLRVYNGTENLTGCHPDRAYVGMRQGTHWSNPSRVLLGFMGDGTLRASDGTQLAGSYQPGQWYDVTIEYSRVGTALTLDYALDGVHVGSLALTIADLAAELSLDHIDLTVQEGAAHFDDVVLLSAGDDCNANGTPDSIDISNGTSADCDGDGMPDECQIAGDGSLDLNGNGVLDSCECLVGRYCSPAAPNSVSQNGARIEATGNPSLSLNGMGLECHDVRAGEYGVFFFGPYQANVPFGDGFRCVGGLLERINPPVLADGNGVASTDLDFTLPPTDGILVGDTLNFQYWYRDPQAVGFGFNLSDALEVTFCP
ncbi:MAG: hypothetical protein QF903_04225 [Planctomycetota bacterium]|jgi:hypothetical protein|nr:hypothetical protein [Planctomycetota bacterium]